MISIDEKKETEFIKITHEQFICYSKASTDFNPIHTDTNIAKEKGFPTVIAHGMYIMGIAGTALMNWFGLERVKSFSVRFTSMTVPGDELSVNCVMDDSKSSGHVFVVSKNGDQKLEGTFCLEPPIK